MDKPSSEHEAAESAVPLPELLKEIFVEELGFRGLENPFESADQGKRAIAQETFERIKKSKILGEYEQNGYLRQLAAMRHNQLVKFVIDLFELACATWVETDDYLDTLVETLIRDRFGIIGPQSPDSPFLKLAPPTAGKRGNPNQFVKGTIVDGVLITPPKDD